MRPLPARILPLLALPLATAPALARPPVPVLAPAPAPAHPPAPAVAPAPAPAHPPAPAPFVPPPPLLTSSLARSAVRAALLAAGFPAAQRRADALLTRITLAALLPDVSFRVARTTDQSLRFSPTYDDPYRYSETGGAGWWVGGTATWRLDRLLFDREELAVERLRAGRAEAAGHLANRVLELLFEWQRGTLDLRDEKLADEARAAAALRAQEASITLDVLTGGWFSKHAGQREGTERAGGD